MTTSSPVKAGAGAGRRHVLVVDAWDGHLEFLTDEPAERAAATGLGLPWRELAGLLDCRVTVLTWDEWSAWELQYGSPFTWTSVRPATRPAPPRPRSPAGSGLNAGGVRCRPIPARDPEHGMPLRERGPGPRSHGLLAGSDPWFWVSYCLRDALVRLVAEDPCDAIILPMWGGFGYAAQLARATGLSRQLDLPFIVVVTDPSSRRHTANQEGHWTREAVVRRQMEDLSLALADGVLAFGSRGFATALAGRLSDSPPPLLAPRRINDGLLHEIEAQSGRPAGGNAVRSFLLEPQQGATGALVALDAIARSVGRGHKPGPFVSAGPDCVFAPMQPRTFREYWSDRGYVRDLMAAGAWAWQTDRPEFAGDLSLRIYPSAFEFLPDVSSELARGSAVLLSPAAAEGLAPGVELPEGTVLLRDPEAEDVADALVRLRDLGVEGVDALRRETCARVAGAECAAERARRLEAVAEQIDAALRNSLPRPDTGRAMRLLLDRTRPLSEIPTDPSAEARVRSLHAAPETGLAGSDRTRAATGVERPGRLSAVITCHEMGALVVESVHSVWASERVPDELMLIDDGSRGAATAESLARLEREAADPGRPLRIVRQDNRGLAAARNRGLDEITGDFVSFLDGDDLLAPAFYGLAVPLLDGDPGLGGVAAWAHIFGDGVPAAGWFWNPPQPELPALLVENGVIVPCVMRTTVLRSLGGYDEGLRYNYEDWDLSIRLLAAGLPILTIPEYLMRYRTRSTSLYRSMTDVQNQVMRERMLEANRSEVSRFGLELAMLTEDRRARAAPGTAAAATASLTRFFDRARGAPAAILKAVMRRDLP